MSESAPDTAAADVKLGARIRRFREERDLTVDQLASRAALGSEALTAYEADARTPPVADILNLADALDVSPGHLLQRDEAEERIEVVRKDARWRIERETGEEGSVLNYNYEALSSRLTDKIMQPFLVELRPGVEPHVSAHAGEEFLLVLRGTVEITVKDKTTTLDEGDSIYFDSRMPHTLKAVGSVPPRLVAVVAMSSTHKPEGELKRAF